MCFCFGKIVLSGKIEQQKSFEENKKLRRAWSQKKKLSAFL
jgi:hypothetical protein